MQSLLSRLVARPNSKRHRATKPRHCESWTKSSTKGEYWEKRDVRALARTVGQWNESIVQQVAALRFVLGNTVQSAVVGFPDTDQLAANGQPVL